MYPKAHLYLTALFALAIFVFWEGYLSIPQAHGVAAHLHGLTAVAWMMMLIAQTWLASRKSFALHKKVGKFVYVLAPLFVIGGMAVVYTMVSSDSPFYAAWGKKLAFYDLTSTLYFAAAVWMAIHYKKQTALHARLMLSTAIPLFLPIFTRFDPLYKIPGVGFEEAIYVGLALSILVSVALIISDHRAGRIRAPWVCVLALTVLQTALMGSVHEYRWWIWLTDTYANLPFS